MEFPHSPGDAGMFTENGCRGGVSWKSERGKNYPADGEVRSQTQICDFQYGDLSGVSAVHTDKLDLPYI